MSNDIRTSKRRVENHPALLDPELRRYDLTNKTYQASECIVICRNSDPYGHLLNMSGHFPVRVNGIRMRTIEALYQSMRFPGLPEVQRKIIETPSPLTAKRSIGPYKAQGREEWYQKKVKIMRWCLHVKLACNYDALAKLLDSSGETPIVETSPDGNFWGALWHDVRNELTGANVFGQLWMEIREEVRAMPMDDLLVVDPPAIEDFLLLGEPVGRVTP